MALVMVVVEWMCRGTITVLFRIIPVPWFRSEDPTKHCTEDPNFERDTLAYIEAKGYHTEEHFVTTPDGYILGLHRIPATDGSDGADEHFSTKTPVRPILIIHGFMQSSEAFTIRQKASDSLPLVLADAGYDVWLGNNRGNKYSHKHVHKKPTHEDFWDYSIDDMVRCDLPTMIDYVLAQSGAKSLTLIGFSQGTAQGFACLSKKTVAAKVNLFIALAPVTTPHGFTNPLVDTLARARPDFIFLLFGKRSILPSTLFWRNNLPRHLFVKIIDTAIGFLFGWDMECIADSEKPLLYSHIYSHASVKTVVQWFQIIQTSKFQMFDDCMVGEGFAYDRYAAHTLPQYQLGHLQTPIACFCGGRDNLPQTAALLASLPKHKVVMVHKEERYEHLDFMWARDIATKIYPKVLELLEKHSNPEAEGDSCEL